MRKFIWSSVLLILFICLGVFVVTAQRNTIYVCSESGDDEHSGGSAYPLRSIAAALERAEPGDVIELAGGVYRETVSFHRSGEIDRPIVLRGAKNKDGELLSTIDPAVLLEQNAWKRAEEIGPDVYVYTAPLPFALSQLVVDDKKIASLHHRADHLEGAKRRYSAWEVLGWDKEHRVPIPGLDEGLPFWDTIRAIYYLAEDPDAQYGEKLYLRFAEGTNPADLEVSIYPDQATVKLDNVSFIWIQDLNIAAGSAGVEISGKNATDNVVEGCTIYLGTERVLVANEASDIRIHNNVLSMRFYGTDPGAWAGGGNDLAAAAKRFVYTYYKYWASPYSTSNDRSIALRKSRDITISDNRIDGGLVGIAVVGSDQVQIKNNTVVNHSSVGMAIRDHNSGIYIDGNYLANNSIQFRLHNLNYGWHKDIYVVRNLSVQPESLGTHVFCHVRADLDPISKDQSPEAYILHNTFVGGTRGIILPATQSVRDGVNDFFIINNLFAVDGSAIHRTVSYGREGLTVGAFDYNLILEPANNPTTPAPWFGEHVLIDTESRLDEDYLPDSGKQRGAAVHLGKVDHLAGRRADHFRFLTDGYYAADNPDIGAIQTEPLLSE